MSSSPASEESISRTKLITSTALAGGIVAAAGSLWVVNDLDFLREINSKLSFVEKYPGKTIIASTIAGIAAGALLGAVVPKKKWSEQIETQNSKTSGLVAR